MKTAFVVVVLGSMLVLACAGGLKDVEKGGSKLGSDVKDSSVTKDVEKGGNKLGSDVADASVTKDVDKGANKVGDDVSGKKDAGAPSTTKPSTTKK